MKPGIASRSPLILGCIVALLLAGLLAMWGSRQQREDPTSGLLADHPPAKISDREIPEKDNSADTPRKAMEPGGTTDPIPDLPEPRGIHLIELGLTPEEVAEVETGMKVARQVLTRKRQESTNHIVLKLGRTYLIPALLTQDIQRAAETVTVPVTASEIARSLIPEMVLAELQRSYGRQATLSVALPGEHNVVFSTLKDGASIVLEDGHVMRVTHVSQLRDGRSSAAVGFEFSYLITPEFREEVRQAEQAYREQQNAARSR